MVILHGLSGPEFRVYKQKRFAILMRRSSLARQYRFHKLRACR